MNVRSRRISPEIMWKAVKRDERSIICCKKLVLNSVFRDQIRRDAEHMLSAPYAIAGPSVRPSVTRVNPTKTVEVRIMKFLPYGSPMTLVFAR